MADGARLGPVTRLLLLISGAAVAVVIALAMLRGGTVPSWIGVVGQVCAEAVEFLARPLSQIGVRDPVVAWIILGALLGALVGRVRGYRAAGSSADAARAFWLGVFAVLGWVAGAWLVSKMR